MGYELLIRPRPGQPPLSEDALRAWLERARREGIAAAAAPAPPPVTEAAPQEPKGEAPSSPAAAPEAAQAQPSPSNLPEPPTAAAAPAHAPAAAGGAVAPSGGPAEPVSWALANGRGTLRARLYRGEAGLLGADLEVPYGGAEDELRSAADFAFRGAQALGATVFDPQLLREIGRDSAEEVVGRWRLSQQWAVDIAGSAEDTRSTLALTETPPFLQRRHKIALGVVAVLVLLYEAVGLILDVAR